ncbi:MAG: hypothetical protein WCO92_03790 [Verrucomicrobiota bacterium]
MPYPHETDSSRKACCHEAHRVVARMGLVLEAASRLPRHQQQKIIEFVDPFIREHTGTKGTAF